MDTFNFRRLDLTLMVAFSMMFLKWLCGDVTILVCSLMGWDQSVTFVEFCNYLSIVCVCSLKSHIKKKFKISNTFGVAFLFVTCGSGSFVGSASLVIIIE